LLLSPTARQGRRRQRKKEETPWLARPTSASSPPYIIIVAFVTKLTAAPLWSKGMTESVEAAVLHLIVPVVAVKR
jgi:hypothetical protein